MSSPSGLSFIFSALLVSLTSPMAMADEDLKMPRLVACAKPAYEEKSITREEEGIVKLAVQIGADGKVRDAKLLSSSGYPNLDKASLSAVQSCSFTASVTDAPLTPSHISFNWVLN
ncbi:MAG: energy transducer TonB [Pseudomonadota bacterium]